MHHLHHHHPTLLSLRRGNSTPSSSAATGTLPLPLPQPLHAFSFPNGISKLPPPPLVVSDPSSSYTSLKDVLPSSTPFLSSPTAASSDISIRHRLVKQAAWAYLQPAAVSPVSPVPSLRRLWANFSSCFRRVFAFLSRLLRRLFPAGPVRFDRY